MPRRARAIVGGDAYHVLNRANGRLRLFRKERDFAACEQVLAEAHDRLPLRILGYVVMGNHWHFVVWPKRNEPQQVSEFFRWLTVTHTQRWHAQHGTAGMGHVSQGRFKSFPIASDEQLLAVLPYGSSRWRSNVVRQLGLEHTPRARGGPRKLKMTPVPFISPFRFVNPPPQTDCRRN
jgi:putative transposase